MKGWLSPYVGLMLMCTLSGLFIGGVRAAKMIKPGQPMRVILIDALSSAFVSFLTSAFCADYFQPNGRPMLTVAIAGITGYMGLAVLDKASAILSERARSLLERTGADSTGQKDKSP